MIESRRGSESNRRIKVLQTCLAELVLLVAVCKYLETLHRTRIQYKSKHVFPSNYSPQKSPQSVLAQIGQSQDHERWNPSRRKRKFGRPTN